MEVRDVQRLADAALQQHGLAASAICRRDDADDTIVVVIAGDALRERRHATRFSACSERQLAREIIDKLVHRAVRDLMPRSHWTFAVSSRAQLPRPQ